LDPIRRAGRAPGAPPTPATRHRDRADAPPHNPIRRARRAPGAPPTPATRCRDRIRPAGRAAPAGSRNPHRSTGAPSAAQLGAHLPLERGDEGAVHPRDLVVGERPIRRPVADGEGEVLPSLAELGPLVDVEELDVLDEPLAGGAA